MNLNIEGKIAVVIGGGGAICGEIAIALAEQGVTLAVWDICPEYAERRLKDIRLKGGKAISVSCDATNKQAVLDATQKTIAEYGSIDILVNGAGGSLKETTTSPENNFFDLEEEGMKRAIALNYFSAIFPSQAIGHIFAQKQAGVILNISSIAGMLPLTRAVSYSDGKAATNSFTRWLAVHMARNYSSNIRVNAIAPGFMLTEQNRFLLMDEKTGQMTERGNTILEHVPMSRYGEPYEIIGAALWLVSDLSSFVTGAVIPVDGGFSAFSGV